ncbi:MAG: Hsp20 family protein [Firmicutes bacterium]|nr:Hsp20 family protein [Bacillota bacterium]MDY5335478.1 Hsp20 family protein [Bacilli bacterium]
MLPSRLFFDDSFFKGDENIKSDIYEKDGRLVVEMEAPGYTKDDINISIDKGTLSITFEKEEEDEENKKYLHRERKSYSKVSRSFYLGDIDEEDIDASFKNGVLVVSAPKKKEIETKKTISIKDSE